MDLSNTLPKSSLKIELNAPTTLIFASICVGVFILDLMTKHAVTDVFFSLFTTSWKDPLQYVRLVSHVFGHADRQHLFNNLIMILLLGPILEEKHSSRRLAIIIGLTAFVTGVTALLLHINIRGASGIVFMLFFLASFSNIKQHRNIPISFLIAIVFFIIEALFFSSSIKNVSYLAHGVGAFCGAMYGWLTEKPGYENISSK